MHNLKLISSAGLRGWVGDIHTATCVIYKVSLLSHSTGHAPVSICTPISIQSITHSFSYPLVLYSLSYPTIP